MDASAETVGVVVVPEGFDATTPIGGLRPLARHVLAMQAAGVTRVVVIGAAAEEDWRRPGVRVSVERRDGMSAYREPYALVVDAEASLHRGALAYVMNRARAREEVGDDATAIEAEPRGWRGASARILWAPAAHLPALVEDWSRTHAQPRDGDAQLPAPLFAVQARTSAQRREATGFHLASLSKPTGGLIDRLVMRPVTRQLTRLLCRTPVTPNMVSVVSIALALVAAYLVSLPAQIWSVVAGALLVAVRFIDCVDGELARLRYQGSKLGAWLDTLGDGVGIFAFVLGALLHAAHASPDQAGRLWLVGGVGLSSWAAVQVLQVAASRRVSGSGSVQELAWGHLQPERTVTERVVGALAVFARIDAISVGYALLVAAGQHAALLWLHAASATTGALYFSGQLLSRRVRRQ